SSKQIAASQRQSQCWSSRQSCEPCILLNAIAAIIDRIPLGVLYNFTTCVVSFSSNNGHRQRIHTPRVMSSCLCKNLEDGVLSCLVWAVSLRRQLRKFSYGNNAIVTIIDRVRLENKNMNIGRILGLGKKGEASGPNPSPQGTTRNGLPISLSRLQTFVSLGAGLVSIIGALVAMPNFFKSGPAKGELVAIVQEAKTDKALSDATIEVLTSQGALVTTLTPNSLGKASCTLEEGRYRVR